MHNLILKSFGLGLPSHSSHYNGPPAKPMDFVIIGLVIGAVVLGFWLVFRRSEAKWHKGVFPLNYRFNKDHLMEAYISAAGIIVRDEPGRMAGKLSFINGYFLREFRNEYYDFKDSFLDALKYPVSTESLAAWLNKHLKQEQDKAKIVYFVINVALWDGDIHANEHRTIFTFIKALGLSDEPFQRYISQRTQIESHLSSESAHSSESVMRLRHLKLLGLEEGSSPEMIKTAYRRLVKMVHPDRHSHASPEVQQQYATQFQQIKEAYDYLIQDN